jgi:hypothetical protein
MIGKPYLKQLRDSDSAQRKKAIKAAARSKDHSALKQLAIMAGDDPDPGIRELARKAGVYIRQQHGELKPTPAAATAAVAVAVAAEDDKPPEIPVTSKDAKEAHERTSAAMTYQMNDDRARAFKELRKALALNPNLRHDAYFVSLSETVTGKLGDEAFKQLSDEEVVNTLAKTQVETRRQRHIEEHRYRVRSARWDSAIFDLSLFFLIAAIGALVLTWLTVESAQALVSQYDERLEAWINAEVDEATGEPIEPMEVDDSFLEFSRRAAELPFTRAILNGLLVGALATASLLLMGALAHGVPDRLLRGTGTLPYLMHRWASMLNIRLLVSLVVGGIGIAVIFAMGGGVAVLVVAGILALIVLLTLFALMSLVAQSYSVSIVKGLIAVSIGALVVLSADATLILMTNLRLV